MWVSRGAIKGAASISVGRMNRPAPTDALALALDKALFYEYRAAASLRLLLSIHLYMIVTSYVYAMTLSFLSFHHKFIWEGLSACSIYSVFAPFFVVASVSDVKVLELFLAYRNIWKYIIH